MKIVLGVALIAAAIIFAPFTPVFFGTTMFAFTGAEAVGLLSLGASLLLGGIAQKIAGASADRGQASNIAIRQAAAPWQVVYGRARIGGVFAYLSVSGDKKYLNMIILHAAHACHAINGYWLDGRQIYFSGGGTSGTADSSDHYDPNGDKYNFKGEVYVEYRLGTETTPAFQSLRAYDGMWPMDAVLEGHCCSYIRCQYDTTMWPNGYPAVRVDVAGKSNIYDPRDGTYKYTENSALCLADILVNNDWGLQCDYNTEVDEAYLIAAANLCDESVTLATGQSEPRYSCNGTFDTTQAPGNILENMLTSCAGRMTCTGGLWRIQPGSWVSPTVSFGDDDIIGPIKWATTRKYRDLANGIRGRFVCPSFPYNINGPGYANNQHVTGVFDGQWQEQDVPYYAQDALHGYGTTIIRVNCGDTVNWTNKWQADFGYSTPSSTEGFSAPVNLSGVTNSAPVRVYECARFGDDFTYTLSGMNPGASVIVRLHFAEIHFTATNQRKFNASINGTQVLTNYDIVQSAGAAMKAVAVSFTATTNGSGQVVIRFWNGTADKAKISGIEILDPTIYYGNTSVNQGDANLAADNGTRLWMDLSLPYTISCAEAQRIFKINLLRNRSQQTATIQTTLKGLQVAALDTITVTHARFGWTNKNFEVLAWRLQTQDAQDGNGPLVYCEMDLQESNTGVYSWSSSEELGIEDNPSGLTPGQGRISQATLHPITTANRNSSIVGGVSPLSAADVGSSCDITIAAWANQTGTKIVSYNSGVIHGASYSTRYYVYTSDKFLRGGAVTYLATQDFEVVTSDQTFVYVDSVVTPAPAGTSTAGGAYGGGGTSGVPSKGNEYATMNVNITGSYPTLSAAITWSSYNVPTGNAVQLQVSTTGSGWSSYLVLASGLTGSYTYSFNAATQNPQFRIQDVTSGWQIN